MLIHLVKPRQVKNKKYYSNSINIDLPIATNNSLELVKQAINGLKEIYKYGYFYQKAGVILSKLNDSSEKELNLLAPIMENKSETLMNMTILRLTLIPFMSLWYVININNGDYQDIFYTIMVTNWLMGIALLIFIGYFLNNVFKQNKALFSY